MAEQRPLANVANAFSELAGRIDSGGGSVALEVAAFSHACALITPLITSLGPLFRLAEIDFATKVHALEQASKTVETLPKLIDADISANTVETLGSPTRNLLRVKRALEMLKVLFREMLAARDGESMIGPMRTSYSEAFGAYHVADAENILQFALAALPTRTQLLRGVNETGSYGVLFNSILYKRLFREGVEKYELLKHPVVQAKYPSVQTIEESARIQMEIYVSASARVIDYVNRLYNSRELGIDW